MRQDQLMGIPQSAKDFLRENAKEPICEHCGLPCKSEKIGDYRGMGIIGEYLVVGSII